MNTLVRQGARYLLTVTTKMRDGVRTQNYNPRDVDQALALVKKERARPDFKSARLYAELEEWSSVP